MIRLVTINTDASFHPLLKYGGYAFWAVSDDFLIKKSGIFRSPPVDPTDAETKCIINALKTVLSSTIAVQRIIINTDSLRSIHGLTNNPNHRKLSMSHRHFRSMIKNILKKSGQSPIIEYRHVKAHSGTGNSRKWVNDWCDREAKKMMRSQMTDLDKIHIKQHNDFVKQHKNDNDETI